MVKKIRVSILDDHQSIIDGYLFRLSQYTDIEVVASGNYGCELDGLLENYSVDVLILDVQVPTAQNNANPFPILYLIPELLRKYPDLYILIISMHNIPALIKSVMDGGASGYILKDDYATIKILGDVIRTVYQGGIFLSQEAYQQLFKKMPREFALTQRQVEAISLCAANPDATTAQLAEQLGVAHSTMRNLLSHAYLRLDVRNRTAAIAKARRMGLITPVEPAIQL